MLRSWLQVLSANAESSINIECLMDDVDVSSELNREQLEEMVAPFLGRLQAVLRSALEMSGAMCGAVEQQQACISSCHHLAGLVRVLAWQPQLDNHFQCAHTDGSSSISSIPPVTAPIVLQKCVH
jgi:hypothetical protein